MKKQKTDIPHTCEPPVGFWEQEARKCVEDLSYMYDNYFAVHSKSGEAWYKAFKDFVNNEKEKR